MMSKKRTIVSLILNIFIFISTTIVIISHFFEEPGVLIRHGYETFRFFTTDSNVLAAICSLIVAVNDICLLAKKTDRLSFPAVMLKYIGTVSVMLTFCTTMFFLVPLFGTSIIMGKYAIVHILTPLLSLVTFAVVENIYTIRFRFVWLGMIPMALYGTVYLTEVVFIGEQNGGWRDFYSFNQGGRWYVTLIVMLAAVFVIALLVALFHNQMAKKNEAAQKTRSDKTA